MTEIQKKIQGTLKEYLKTSLPAVVDLSIQPLVWLYEAFLIGQISFAALGSVGLAFQFVLVTFTAVLTFVVGSSLIINRHLGQKKTFEANHIFGQAMVIGIFLSFVIALIWYFGSPVLFKIIKESEPHSQTFGINYLQTLAYFAPIAIICFIALGIIRGTGDTQFALIINIVIISINVILAPLLIFGQFGLPRLEERGLALAKGISFAVGFVLTGILVRSRKINLYLSIREMTNVKWESVKILFRSGFPTTVEQLTWSTGMFVVSTYVARLGVIVLATHQILLLIQGVMSMIYQGLGMGSMILIGKKVGADEHHHAERTGFVAGGVTLSLVLVVAWAIYTFQVNLFQVFTDSQEILDLGLTVIIIFAFVQIPKALNSVLIGNLRGAGELQWIMWVTILGVAIFEVSASWVIVFVFQFALAGIWIVHGCDEISRFLFNFIRFRNGKWKLQNL